MSTPANEPKRMQPKAIRRVVTGHDAAGTAVVVNDGQSPDIAVIEDARITIADMWRMSSVPTSVDAWETRDPSAPTTIAVAGGLNFAILQFDPIPADAAIDGEAAFADAHVENARHPAMHRTETVDFGIVISGSITLLLDTEDVTLSAGDVVIQRGTNHAWENRGDVPCTMAFVIVDAQSLPSGTSP